MCWVQETGFGAVTFWLKVHYPMAGRNRLLIVDDQIAIVQLLEEFLADEGYDVESLAGGAEAVQRLGQRPVPDLLVLDIMMPEVNGWEVLDRLRAQPETAHTPVILLTAAPKQAQYVFKTRQPERCILLAKPIGLEELLTHIQVMLSTPPGRMAGGGPEDSGRSAPPALPRVEFALRLKRARPATAN